MANGTRSYMDVLLGDCMTSTLTLRQVNLALSSRNMHLTAGRPLSVHSIDARCTAAYHALYRLCGSMLSVTMMGAGGQLLPAVAEENEQVGKQVKQKISRKERLQRKRDQKRAERQAGSDDEDVNQGEYALGHGHVDTFHLSVIGKSLSALL